MSADAHELPMGRGNRFSLSPHGLGDHASPFLVLTKERRSMSADAHELPMRRGNRFSLAPHGLGDHATPLLALSKERRNMSADAHELPMGRGNRLFHCHLMGWAITALRRLTAVEQFLGRPHQPSQAHSRQARPMRTGPRSERPPASSRDKRGLPCCSRYPDELRPRLTRKAGRQGGA